MNRLKRWGRYSEHLTPYEERYTYDKVGNRTLQEVYVNHTILDDTLGYEYGNNNNQLTKMTTFTTSSDTFSYSRRKTTTNKYTGDGALQSRLYKDVSQHFSYSYTSAKWETFGYSYNGLLKKYGNSYWGASGTLVDNCYMDTTSPPQWQWEYRYSAGGERESKRHAVAPLDGYGGYPHLWTYYLLGGNKQQLAVYNGRETSEADACSNTGHRVHFYPTEYLTYGNGGSALITTRPNQNREYKIVDHLGSTRVVLDSNGTILSTYDYEPFGKPLVKTGLDSRKSFIDREKDGESETNNFGVRQYDDDIGRFDQTEPMWEQYPSQSMYQYSLNNPIKLYDKDGNVVRDKDGNVVFVTCEEPKVLPHPSGLHNLMQPGFIFADDGTEIQAFKNLSGDNRFDTDCHGMCFADGQVWIDNSQVDKLIKGDGYKVVCQPQKGDIALYREQKDVVHSMKVVNTKKNADATVKGKAGIEPVKTCPAPQGFKTATSVEYLHKNKKDVKAGAVKTDKRKKDIAE